MKYHRKLLDDWDLKKKVISLLYDKFNLHGFRYTIITKSSHLNFLQQNEHYLLLNYASKSYLLVFFLIDEKKMCFLIDRKSLVYQPKNINDVVRSSVVMIIEPHQSLKNDLFRGTILDVKMVNNFFHVYNVFMWKGEDKTGYSTLESYELLNNERIEMIPETRPYFYRDLRKLKNILIEDSKVTGLIFIPKIPGNQMIFLQNKTNSEPTTTIVSTPIHIIATMIQHDLPDVYFLNLEENKKMTKKIAYIPNIECSKKCQEFIRNKKEVKVKCTYNTQLDKYIPIDLA